MERRLVNENEVLRRAMCYYLLPVTLANILRPSCHPRCMYALHLLGNVTSYSILPMLGLRKSNDKDQHFVGRNDCNLCFLCIISLHVMSASYSCQVDERVHMEVAVRSSSKCLSILSSTLYNA